MGALVVCLPLVVGFFVLILILQHRAADSVEASRRRGNRRRRRAARRYGWATYTHELANGRLATYNA